MRNVFPDPRRDDPPHCDDRPYRGDPPYREDAPSFSYGDPPPGYPEEAPAPEPARAPYYPAVDPPEVEPERGRGCSWLLVFILLLAVGAFALVSWGVTHLILSGMVTPLRENYRTLSLLPAQRVQTPKAEMQLQLYYVARGRSLAPETRRLRKPASENERLRLIAQELRKPPSGKLLENPFPSDTDINGVYLMNGIAFVDLGIQFTKVDKPTPLKERLAVYALVNSLMLNNRSIQGVQIMIDGRPATTAWGWLDLSSPLGPDLSMEASIPPGGGEG